MNKRELKHISETKLAELRSSISSNLPRYRGRGFADVANDLSWEIGLKIDFDADLLSTLDTALPQNIVEIDRKNSKIVGEALNCLTPSLANEELIWVRLSHVEAFSYSQSRWLSKAKGDKESVREINTHFFAPTQTAIRDDHGISRLWWNHHIAKLILPEDVNHALELIMKTADIRSNFVERIWMSSRKNIANAILRAMQSKEEITASERNFRMFMKIINRNGGGIVFETLDDSEIDNFVVECCEILNKAISSTYRHSQTTTGPKFVDGEI